MDALKATLLENLTPAPRISFFGLFTVSSSVLVCFGITIVLSLLALFLTRNLKKVPTKSQMLLEMCIGFFNDFCKEHLGKHWRPLAPWLGTVALFIVSCNLAGLFGFPPPTKDISVTATLALLSVLLIYGAQFYYNGIAKGLHHFIQPTPILLPINLMEIAIRPLSLCMRLFGNVLATHLMMEIIHCFLPVVIPVFFSLYFDLFDGLIQMAVFVFLTTLFTAEAIGAEPETAKAT